MFFFWKVLSLRIEVVIYKYYSSQASAPATYKNASYFKVFTPGHARRSSVFFAPGDRFKTEAMVRNTDPRSNAFP